MGLVIAVATIASYGAIAWALAIWAAGIGSPLRYAIAPAVLALLLAAAWRRMPEDRPERRRERAQRGKIIGDVTAAMVVLIAVVLYMLRAMHRADLFGPIVAIVVGLHFLAFARLFPARIYYLTSLLLVALGVAGFFLDAGSERTLIVGIGAAGILWLTCAAVIVWPESRRTRAGTTAPASPPATG